MACSDHDLFQEKGVGPGSKFFEGVEALEAGDGRDGSVGGGFVERLNEKA